ncbi:tRNA1(Val) (adenine(37)-N6)-methyltransferase [Pseudidiomarina gelatinasegens]|uniref:tRNA1(Val) (adenine(37)-N6)-methyltransferase n=1 Tax=Pseudidiomarina gelatinasegens TaxID=2487740 RepID=UPI0030EBEBDE
MGFQCQQFYLKDDQCAMKVSTDSLLFGAWVDVTGSVRIADFGTGCGVLALMLAQRAEASASIDAIELDVAAAQQARDNVAASPWPEKITVYQGDVLAFATKQGDYDLVVMNPPYFPNHLPSSASKRSLARQGEGDIWQRWLAHAASQIHNQGRIALVAPMQALETIFTEAQALGLHACRQLQVQSVVGKSPYLVLLELRPTTVADCNENETLVIRNPDNKYTNEYAKLTADFYLKK